MDTNAKEIKYSCFPARHSNLQDNFFAQAAVNYCSNVDDLFESLNNSPQSWSLGQNLRDRDSKQKVR